MQDLSLHILDVGENAVTAGATLIHIAIHEDIPQNRLLLEITDNGKGLDETARQKALDPFYTTKSTKRVGLGLPMLAQAAKEAGGDLTLQSEKGKGTTIRAHFVHDHIDRKPMGDIAATLIALISGGENIDILYQHHKNNEGFQFDTREIKKELQEVPINNPDVLNYLKKTINKGITEL